MTDWVRSTVFERQRRISTIESENGRVFLLLDDDALLRQCDVDCYRSSGPGGQKKNKTSSAVRLRHGPTGLIVIAEEDRSQHVNKRRALRRLREAIALKVRAAAPLPEKQGAAAPVTQATLTCITGDGRLAVGRRDARYYVVVDEVLDLLVRAELRVSDAARALGIGTASLVKFLQRDRKLWDRVNRLRVSGGLKPLRSS